MWFRFGFHSVSIPTAICVDFFFKLSLAVPFFSVSCVCVLVWKCKSLNHLHAVSYDLYKEFCEHSAAIDSIGRTESWMWTPKSSRDRKIRTKAHGSLNDGHFGMLLLNILPLLVIRHRFCFCLSCFFLLIFRYGMFYLHLLIGQHSIVIMNTKRRKKQKFGCMININHNFVDDVSTIDAIRMAGWLNVHKSKAEWTNSIRNDCVDC